MNPILSFRIIIQYDGVHNSITNLITGTHIFSADMNNMSISMVFFLNNQQYLDQLLLGSFKLDKRIFSHCNDSIFKQHTCIHEYRT